MGPIYEVLPLGSPADRHLTEHEVPISRTSRDARYPPRIVDLGRVSVAEFDGSVLASCCEAFERESGDRHARHSHRIGHALFTLVATLLVTEVGWMIAYELAAEWAVAIGAAAGVVVGALIFRTSGRRF